MRLFRKIEEPDREPVNPEPPLEEALARLAGDFPDENNRFEFGQKRHDEKVVFQALRELLNSG